VVRFEAEVLLAVSSISRTSKSVAALDHAHDARAQPHSRWTTRPLLRRQM
jgi:hypothetical protein